MKHILVIGLIAGLAFGYVPFSFRHLSTAGLFIDDYDLLLLNPSYIPQVSGARLYTNLSNFYNGEECLFTEKGEGAFLLGIKPKSDKLGIFSLIDFSDYRTPLNTGLVSEEGDTLYGYGTIKQTVYSNYDSIQNKYLDKTIMEETREAWEENNIKDFHLALGYKIGEELNIGFSYSYSKEGSVLALPENNAILKGKDYTEEKLVYEDSLFSAGFLKNQKSSHSLLLGLGLLKEKREILAKVGIIPYSEIEDYDSTFSNYIENSYVETVEKWDTVKTDTLTKSSVPITGFIFPVQVFGVNHFEENLLWWIAEFSYKMGSASENASEEHIISQYKIKNEIETTTSSILNDTTLTHISGSSSGLFLSFHFGYILSIDERLSLGIGGGMSFSRNNSSFLYQGTHVSNYRRTAETTYDSIATSSFSDSTKRYERILGYRFPVAVEFKLTKPLTLRLGTAFNYWFTNTQFTKERISYTPQKIVIREDESETEIHETDYDLPFVYEEEDKKESATQFTYGIGYAYKNLTIDLMGFSELFNLSGYRVSVTLKF